MTVKEKLKDDLKDIVNKQTPIILSSDLEEVCEDLFRFIHSRDAKNLEPLVECRKCEISVGRWNGHSALEKQVDQTLTNFGVEIGGK